MSGVIISLYSLNEEKPPAALVIFTIWIYKNGVIYEDEVPGMRDKKKAHPLWGYA